MTTALDDPKTVLRAFGGLCDAYLIKPVGKASLLGQLESLGLLR